MRMCVCLTDTCTSTRVCVSFKKNYTHLYTDRESDISWKYMCKRDNTLTWGRITTQCWTTVQIISKLSILPTQVNCKHAYYLRCARGTQYSICAESIRDHTYCPVDSSSLSHSQSVEHYKAVGKQFDVCTNSTLIHESSKLKKDGA